MINVHTNQVVRVIGKSENTTRFMHLGLFQGAPKAKGLLTLVSAGGVRAGLRAGYGRGTGGVRAG